MQVTVQKRRRSGKSAEQQLEIGHEIEQVHEHDVSRAQSEQDSEPKMERASVPHEQRSEHDTERRVRHGHTHIVEEQQVNHRTPFPCGGL